MTKKVIALLLSTVLMLGCLGVSAAAETAEPEVLAAYRTESTLYSFLSVDENNTVKFRGSDAELGGNLAEPRRIMEGEYGASYVVLLDITESMEEYMDDVKLFLNGVMKNKVWSSRMILVPYVSSPHLNSMTDTKGMSRDESIAAINEAIDNIGLINADNHAYSSVAEMVDFMNTNCYASVGDLINLILITDNFNESKGSKAFEAAKSNLEASPELLFHTVVFGNEKNKGSKLGGKGLNLTVNENLDADSASKEMVSKLSGIQRIALSWPMQEQIAERESVEWYLQFWHEAAVSTSVVNMENVALLVQNESGQLHVIGHEVTAVAPEEMPAEEAATELEPEQDQPVQETEPVETPADQESVDALPDNGNEDTAPENVAESPEEEPVTITAGDEDAGNTETDFNSLEEKLKDNAIVIAAVALAVLLVLVVVLIICLGKKKSKPDVYSIFMQLEVLSGKCVSKKREFNLADELLIGSNKKCDVVFKDAEVSPTNTRIFVRDGFIYVADLNSERGTALEGMRIFSPNRLRSGEQISIGSVRFRFNF